MSPAAKMPLAAADPGFLRAKQLMPWGTQTNAKRHIAELGEVMPARIKRAKGCRMWAADGREFIDYRCALGPIILGYADEVIDAAVRKQQSDGVLFSMAHPIELEAAEAIIENVPWLEQIRFMKTGADACTACVRLARAYTGRQHVLTCGYHGYHDAFALQWPDHGAPDLLSMVMHEVAYGDIKQAEAVFSQFGNRLAAAIVVPYDWQDEPAVDWLKRLRELCDQHGSALIFDEILTGFRLAKGGAQERFGVTPDLAAYAKAMANGYPVSAFGGKAQFMQQLQKTIITTTYAGETLSLAASIATMRRLNEPDFYRKLRAQGERLRDGFKKIFSDAGLNASVNGLSEATNIAFASRQQELAFFRGMLQQGVFPNPNWFICESHRQADIDETLIAARAVVQAMQS